jgi:hypothetical protein
MQRIANQGARWAVVARYPLPNGSMCTTSTTATPTGCDPSLAATLASEAQSDGLRPDVCITFPAAGASSVGDPVRIRLESDFTFVPILGIGTLTLGADAEMRIEQQRGNVYDATPGC